jgi:hypothetical protein
MLVPSGAFRERRHKSAAAAAWISLRENSALSLADDLRLPTPIPEPRSKILVRRADLWIGAPAGSSAVRRVDSSVRREVPLVLMSARERRWQWCCSYAPSMTCAQTLGFEAIFVARSARIEKEDA